MNGGWEQAGTGRSVAEATGQTRRTLLAHAACFGAVAGVDIGALTPASAQAGATKLSVERRTIEVLGRAATVFGIRQPNGTEGIFLDAGQRFRVDLTNNINEETILHWHGQTPPWPQDGVVSSENSSLTPRTTRSYDYATRPGTHWMHSHVGLQEQLLLAAPLIVRSAEDARADVQEVTILLADFTFRDPAEILGELQRGAKMADMARQDETAAMPSMAPMPSMPGMADAAPGAPPASLDLNDVEYDAFLANDRALDDPQVVRVERNGRLRLRIINGATTSAFHIDLGSLEGQIIAVDGNSVKPLSGHRFSMSMAQRLDILLSIPGDGGAWPILAQREGDVGRAGIILATPGARIEKVSPRAEAAAPALDMSLEERLVAMTPLRERGPDQVHRIALTGDMRSYIWSIDERTWGSHLPLKVRPGQRVVIEMRNTTPMPHPMHLHGHHFQVVGINGRPLQGAVRDTILVSPLGSVAVAFDTDNPGRWLLHCHNLLHRDVGMQTEVTYES